MSFWNSGSGAPITGEASKAFVPEFTIIPNNTTAKAKIKAFELIESESPSFGKQRFYQVIWKLSDGDYINREVTQKIKAFDGKPEQIDRALNMMKLIMDLCQFKPSHNNPPTTQELSRMHGKELGIKVREWSMPKNDGSGLMEGNFVAEVYPLNNEFVTSTGKRIEHVSSAVESAFSRNSQGCVSDLDEDLPF